MGMQTDVRPASLPVSGTAFDGRTRLRGLLVEPGSGVGSVTFRDGTPGDAVVMQINTVAGGEPFSVIIPAEGVLFQVALYVELTNARATVFYG